MQKKKDMILLKNENNTLPLNKEETPKVEYFVKVNDTDPNTDTNTFEKFSDAKEYADQNVKNGFKVYILKLLN